MHVARRPGLAPPIAARDLRTAMAQNIYDDPAFFAGYSRLRRSTEGLDGAPE